MLDEFVRTVFSESPGRFLRRQAVTGGAETGEELVD
jgi:hypothetical protein